MNKKINMILLGMLLLTSGTFVTASTADQDINTPSILYFQAHAPKRAWQGVAVDGNYVYVLGDGNQQGLTNVITAHKHDGTFVKEKKDAYTKTDKDGFFMGFGDGTIIDGYLYATVYNWNARPDPETLESRIVKYSLPDLDVVGEYDIGGNVAESITKYLDDFWVVYHDIAKIRRFDSSWNLKQEYVLSQEIESNGGYQGAFWIGSTLHVNMHGANYNGGEYAYGLDRYNFDGVSFSFLDRTKPPTYGSGQGIDYYNGNYYWADRVENRIVITNTLKAGALQVYSPANDQSFIHPELLSEWSQYDENRTVTVWKDQFGVVHLQGLIKGGSMGKVALVLPKGYRPAGDLNIIALSNDDIGKVNIVGTHTANKGWEGYLIPKSVAGSNAMNTWFSIDGISFIADTDE